MKSKFINILQRIHLFLFKVPMSVEMKKFLGNLSWSLITGLITMPILMIASTLAGRYIGPVEFGKYNLLLVIYQFLAIFIFFGLDTTVIKYIAKARTDKEKTNIISATSFYIISVLFILVLVSIISFPIINKYSEAYSLIIILVAIYTLILSIKMILDLYVRSLENFKIQAKGKIIETIVILIAFYVLFIRFNSRTYSNYVFIICAGAVATSFFYFLYLRKYFNKFNKTILLEQLKEGKLFFVGGILGTLFLSSDKIFIARFLGLKTLGVYSAYYFASIGIITIVAQLFTNVFFPATSRTENKSFIKKVDKLFIVSFLPLTLLISAITTIMLLIFGREYPISVLYLILFSLLAASKFFLNLYNVIIVDIPVNMYKKQLYITNGLNAITLLVYSLFIYLNIISITVIVIGLIINFLVTTVIQRSFVVNYCKT